jgi:hypothetical protein
MLLSSWVRGFAPIGMLGLAINMDHLISRRALRVRREKSKKIFDLCGLCEKKGK